MTKHEEPREPGQTPSATAESEERETLARSAADREAAIARSEREDPRAEEGWTQPESSAQKGAPRDEG